MGTAVAAPGSVCVATPEGEPPHHTRRSDRPQPDAPAADVAGADAPAGDVARVRSMRKQGMRNGAIRAALMGEHGWTRERARKAVAAQ